MSTKNKIYEYKKMKVGNAIHHLFKEATATSWKHHNPEGPAIEPAVKGDKSVKKEYYLYGVSKTIEEFKDFQGNREGLPFYKSAGMNVRN